MTSHFKTDKGRPISLLGYGAMRLPTVDGGHANGWVKDGYSTSNIDQELMNRQVKYLLDQGVTYFDTSPAYCRGESEERLGTALRASGYDRKDYVLATKLSNFAPQQQTLDGCKAMFGQSLKFLRTDYVDNYLLHSVGMGGWEAFENRFLKNGAADWCRSLRDQGRIRKLGFSYHGDRKAFDWCMEHHDRYHWDFCQIQMNYVDWLHASEMGPGWNLDAKYLYDTLTEKGIPVVIMEPLLGGRLARYNWALAQELKPLAPADSLAKWAFRFCGSHPNVMTVLSGMTRMSDIEENCVTFSPLKPCSPAEFAALERAAQALLKLNTIPCNDCKYCMPCPYGLDIPALLTFRNLLATSQTALSAQEKLALYRKTVPEELRRADHCTGCRRCVPHCPQGIDIPKALKDIDALIEEAKNEIH